jgi:hypothetical protein
MVDAQAGVDLYWLPLGAGGHSVRLNGKIYEAVVSRLERRGACDLYHSALVVCAREGRFVVEQAPVWRSVEERGVVSEGVVGARWLGRFRLFRYELRCWRDGVIPDIDEAVDSPRSLTDDPEIAQHVIDLAPSVPTYVWGRDTPNAEEMWNSNSAISWLLTRGGIDAAAIHAPAGGRAPGWTAGVVVAKRQEAAA